MLPRQQAPSQPQSPDHVHAHASMTASHGALPRRRLMQKSRVCDQSSDQGDRSPGSCLLQAARNKARQEGQMLINKIHADVDPCASAHAEIVASRDAAMRVAGVHALHALRADSEFFDLFTDKTYNSAALSDATGLSNMQSDATLTGHLQGFFTETLQDIISQPAHDGCKAEVLPGSLLVGRSGHEVDGQSLQACLADLVYQRTATSSIRCIRAVCDSLRQVRTTISNAICSMVVSRIGT